MLGAEGAESTLREKLGTQTGPSQSQCPLKSQNLSDCYSRRVRMYSEGPGEHTRKEAASDGIKVWEEGRREEEEGSNNNGILFRGSMKRGRYRRGCRSVWCGPKPHSPTCKTPVTAPAEQHTNRQAT